MISLKRFGILVGLITLAAALGSACGSDEDAAPVEPGPDGGAAATITEVACDGAAIAGTVTTPGLRFEPMTTTINAGQIVCFAPSASHDAKSNTAGLFQVDLGETGCFKFETAGSFGFHCVPHGFQGTIVVK